MAFFDSIFGSSPQIKETPSRFTPNQTAFFDQILSGLPSLSERLQKPTDISPIIAERTKAYETQGQNSIMNRFAGMSPTAQFQSGSGINAALAGGLQNLQENLASLQAQTKLQDLGRQQNLFGLLSQLGGQPMKEHYLQPGRSGLVSEFGAPLMHGLGAYLGSGGNPIAGITALLSQFGSKSQPESYTQEPGSQNNMDYDKLVRLLYGLISQRTSQA